MRDRRERVMNAMLDVCPWMGPDTLRQCADAALSALDAEPTNAEIVEIQEDIFRTESRYIDKSSIRSVLRSALIAARKEGQR